MLELVYDRGREIARPSSLDDVQEAVPAEDRALLPAPIPLRPGDGEIHETGVPEF